MTGNSHMNLCSDWIVDTGANDHMAGKGAHLYDKVSYAGTNGNVQLPDGNKTSVTQSGSISLTLTIVLHNVLFVPTFHFNLLSVSKFIKDRHCFVVFHPKFCFFSGLMHWEEWSLSSR